MTKKIKEKLIRTLYRAAAIVGACGFFVTAGIESMKRGEDFASAVAVAESDIKEIKNNASAKVNLHTEKYFDNDVVFEVPSTIAADDEISLIVTMNSASLVEVYKEKNTKLSLTEFTSTREAEKIAKKEKKRC